MKRAEERKYQSTRECLETINNVYVPEMPISPYIHVQCSQFHTDTSLDMLSALMPQSQ